MGLKEGPERLRGRFTGQVQQQCAVVGHRDRECG
jgi:hypothetical protein